MKTKTDYLMAFLIVIFGLDILDRHTDIPQYILVPIILFIIVVVFVQIVYYSFSKGKTRMMSIKNNSDSRYRHIFDPCQISGKK